MATATATRTANEAFTLRFDLPRSLECAQICDIEIALEEHPEVVHVQRCNHGHVTFIVTHAIPPGRNVIDTATWESRRQRIRDSIVHAYATALQAAQR